MCRQRMDCQVEQCWHRKLGQLCRLRSVEIARGHSQRRRAGFLHRSWSHEDPENHQDQQGRVEIPIRRRLPNSEEKLAWKDSSNRPHKQLVLAVNNDSILAGNRPGEKENVRLCKHERRNSGAGTGSMRSVFRYIPCIPAGFLATGTRICALLCESHGLLEMLQVLAS